MLNGALISMHDEPRKYRHFQRREHRSRQKKKLTGHSRHDAAKMMRTRIQQAASEKAGFCA
jgi:hypothetical protein